MATDADVPQRPTRPRDSEAMAASNPGMMEDVASPEDAARRVLEALLRDEHYVVTHGNLVGAVEARCDELRRAAHAAM